MRRIQYSSPPLESKPGNLSRRFRIYKTVHGENAAWRALDDWLGDNPGRARVQRLSGILGNDDQNLRRMADSTHSSRRRLSRLMLLENDSGRSGDPLLFAGLSDPSPRIRSDAAGRLKSVDDRRRLYNRLAALISDDPSPDVRQKAADRLIREFADLYTPDLKGLPELARPQLIWTLRNRSSADVHTVEKILESENKEEAFTAARKLRSWGILARYWTDLTTAESADKAEGFDRKSAVLSRAASFGIADYLLNDPVPPAARESAEELAALAGLKDLPRPKESSDNSESGDRSLSGDFSSVYRKITQFAETADPNCRSEFSPEERTEEFRAAVEAAFPVDAVPSIEIECRLLRLAAAGGWKNWMGRFERALSSGDSRLRITALENLAPVAGESVCDIYTAYLHNRNPQLRRLSAGLLASCDDGAGLGPLVDAMESSPETEDLIIGIREAGDAVVAGFVIGSAEKADTALRGRLLREGLGAEGLSMLCKAYSRATDLNTVFRSAGPAAGASILENWSTLSDSGKKKLLSWIKASGWPAEALANAQCSGRPARKNLRRLLSELDRESRQALFSAEAEKADGPNRRLIRQITRS